MQLRLLVDTIESLLVPSAALIDHTRVQQLGDPVDRPSPSIPTQTSHPPLPITQRYHQAMLLASSEPRNAYSKQCAYLIRTASLPRRAVAPSDRCKHISHHMRPRRLSHPLLPTLSPGQGRRCAAPAAPLVVHVWTAEWRVSKPQQRLECANSILPRALPLLSISPGRRRAECIALVRAVQSTATIRRTIGDLGPSDCDTWKPFARPLDSCICTFHAETLSRHLPFLGPTCISLPARTSVDLIGAYRHRDRRRSRGGRSC